MRELRQFAHLARPRLHHAVRDRRLADVIEDHRHFRDLSREFQHVRHVAVIDADVEGEVEIGERAHALDEIRPQAEIEIGLELDDAADAAQDVVSRQALDIGRNSATLLQRCPGDHALDARIDPGETSDPFGLLLVLGGIDLALQEHHSLDIETLGRRRIAVEPIGLVEHGIAVKPGITQLLRIPEMEMRIDNRTARHQTPLARMATTIASPSLRMRFPSQSNGIPQCRKGASTQRPLLM